MVLACASFVINAEPEPDYSVCHSQGDSAKILDSAFNYVNTKFCEPAIWFDNFFVDDRTDQDSRAGSTVRWINDFSYVEGEGLQYTSRLKMRLHLPKVTKRLKLVFESEDEDNVFDLLPQNSQEAENSLGLRYDWLRKERYSFNIKVTAKPSIEGRFRYTHSITEDLILRVTQKIYQRDSVTGESTQVDFDYSFSPDYLFRWSSIADYDDEISGWEIGTGLTLYQHISDNQALSYQANTTGTNRPFHYITNSQVAITYRQQFWRPWLFYELIPEYNWNREEDTQREGEAMVTLRLEVLFNNI